MASRFILVPGLKADPYPQVVVWTPGLRNKLTERRTPLLGKGGVAAPIKKKPRSLLSGRRRGVGSTSDNRWLERTTLPCFALSGSHSLRSCPSAPERNGVILLMARPPLLCQGGEFAFPLVVLKCPNSRHLSITTTPQSIHEPGLEYPMQTAGH